MTTAQKIMRVAAFPLMAALLVSAIGFAPTSAAANEGERNLSATASPTVSITDGKALVRGAKVTSVSGNTINAGVTWGSTTLNFTVTTDAATKYYNRLGNTGAAADIATGDTISFGGVLSSNGLTVLASAVKDMTGSVSNATVSGKVASTNTGALSLVISKGKDEHAQSGNITVTTNASTTILMNGVALPFGSIQTGDKVKATGLLAADGTTIAATALEVTRPATVNNGNFNQFIKDFFKGSKGHGKDN